MEGKRSNPTESDEFSVEQESDRSSEEQTTETLDRQNKDRNKQICNPCFLGQFIKVMAFYMCYVCEKSFCKACFSGHDKSHGFLSLQSESEQLEREIDEYLSYIKNESDAERKEKFMKNNVCVCDYVDTKHGLDKDKNCDIFGLTGYANKWWVVSDSRNYCIKVFSLGSNVLQRYIRLNSRPCDVTEIIVNEPDRKHLLAVMILGKRYILILDLGKNPAVIHSKIKTEKYCWSIDFYDGNLYTACTEHSPYSLYSHYYSVYILSVEGVTLKTFQTDIPDFLSRPYLTVLNGNIYMTDPNNDRVVCYNDEGRILHQIRIDGSGPQGICVDRSEDKVYVSSLMHNKVYELKSDLSRYKPFLDQTTRYMEGPWVICFYNDKLYVGHYPRSESRSHVTVVRLL